MMGGTNWPTTSVRLVAAMRRPEDRAAWERFSTEYAPTLLQFCEHRGLQRTDAEDVVQTIFLGVHRALKRTDYRPDRGRFRSWLSTIALRTIWKLRVRELAHPRQLVDPDRFHGLAAPEQLLEEINASVLQLAFDEIRAEFDKATWEAFSSIWFQDEHPQAVAMRIGRPASWVYKAKFRVLQRVKMVVGRMARELDEFQSR